MTAEPQSMEDILASIKRIIAEDSAALAPPSVHVKSAPADDEDILELDAPTPPSAGLVSPAAAEASRSALSALSSLGIRPDAPPDTVEGLVRELIRPLLKEWLDANLPGIVERMVALEIARIGQR